MTIAVGDEIVPNGYPDAFRMEVMEVARCTHGLPGGEPHDQYRIIDPELGEEDWVCSRDVVKAT